VKKACAFILALFYLSFSVGATLYQHYCMGEFVGASLLDLKEEECGKCGMQKHTEESKNCCKDVPIVIKTNDSHTFSQIAYDIGTSTFISPTVYFISDGLSILKAQTENLYRGHSPPLPSSSLYIRFQNFRI
jgi:hypothetical protein